MKKRFNKEMMKRSMRPLWKTDKGLRIRDINLNLFLFMFNEEEDRSRVIMVSPWLYDRCVQLLKPIDENTHPSNIKLDHAPFWVRIYEVSYVGMTTKAGEKIKELIGQVERVEVVHGKGELGSYML
ncbi:DUF4283 domain-containing protein [Cephalotus follicularis]|uniref:DUF4283 domain-containing protein n=1 Tax=Cephalotus follicularis TaxID=3775 RepID=A0A1Q3AZL7_CEPFO|nr:DUF4283 domain-containing protein [Cephalotus follicularis]